jgi:hypothetical protein
MYAALTNQRTRFKGTQAMMIERSSSPALVCMQTDLSNMVCLMVSFIDVLEVQHVS